MKQWFGAVMRPLVGLVAMTVGTAGVCWLVLLMNGPGVDKAAEAERPAVAFSPAPQKKKPKKDKPKPKRTPKAATPKASRPGAPPPLVGMGLSTVSLGIPPVGDAALDAGQDDLLGAAADPKSLVMDDRSVDSPPKPRFTPKPRFPPRAAQEGLSGKVVVKILIDPAGSVADVRLVSASPGGVFDGPVLEAVRQWRFEPARYKGQPVKMWTTKTLRFEAG